MAVAMREKATRRGRAITFSEVRRNGARVKLGRIIRSAREDAGMTQREVGMRMPRFCDGNQVSRWERGEHVADHDRLMSLIWLFRFDEEEILNLWQQASLRKPKMRRREGEVRLTLTEEPSRG